MLTSELLELSARVDEFCKIKSVSIIIPTLELGQDVTLPYIFKCEALHPGIYKGFTIEEMEIIKAKDTIFDSDENFHNYEINKDHKSSRKEESSVDDILGKVIKAEYDYSTRSYVLTGEIYDEAVAVKIAKNVIKYVSLRINPAFIEEANGQRYARGLRFEELSFVRAPGDPNAKVIIR